MVVSGGNAVHIVGTFKHLGTDADFKVLNLKNIFFFDKLMILVYTFDCIIIPNKSIARSSSKRPERISLNFMLKYRSYLCLN